MITTKLKIVTTKLLQNNSFNSIYKVRKLVEPECKRSSNAMLRMLDISYEDEIGQVFVSSGWKFLLLYICLGGNQID